jgi:hypothetical protein
MLLVMMIMVNHIDDVTFTYGFSRELYAKVDPAHISRKKMHNIVRRWNQLTLKLKDEDDDE